MPRIDAQLQSDASNIFNSGELDETVTYQQSGGANSASVSAHITPSVDVFNDGLELHAYKMDVLLVATDDLPSGSPKSISKGDQPDEVIIDSVTWYVYDIINVDPGFTELRIVDQLTAFAE